MSSFEPSGIGIYRKLLTMAEIIGDTLCQK